MWAELRRHVSQIRMTPTRNDDYPFYVAEGAWNLVGKRSEMARMRQCGDWRIRMIAGVRNLPIAPTIRFEIPILEAAA